MQNILMFGDPMQYDAAKGERGLKDWAKHMSLTAQKCGIDIFLYQTIHRVATHQLMQRAQQSDLWRKNRVERSREGFLDAPVEVPKRAVMNRKMPHFRYRTETKLLHSLDRKGKETLATVRTGVVDMRIISKILKDHDDLEEIDIWGEIYLVSEMGEGGQLLRGHPTYDRFGEMFDWAVVTFDTADPNNEGLVGPAKLLAFYKDGEGEERAVIHATHVTTGNETSAGNTLLVQNNRLEFNQKGFPALRTIRVDQIDRGLLAFEHQNFQGPLPPTTTLQSEKNKYVVSCIEDRANWAHLFFEWANELPAVEIQPARQDTVVECDTDDGTDISDSD
jgi:hypothetical protein